MRAEILKSGDAAEYFTEERCHIVEIANDAGDRQLSIARARVEPGVTTAWHRLIDTSERYVIVAGRGRVEIGDLDPADVSAGDVVRIPAGVRQRISNTGTADLLFYAVCAPPFQQRNYVRLEPASPGDRE